MQYLLFDGILNNGVLGIPIYGWMMLAFFLIAVFSYAIWYFFFWIPLAPLHGHFKAHVSKTNSAFVFDQNNNFKMVSEKKAKLIYDIKTVEAKKLQKDWDVAPSGLIGRVLTDLIFDGGGWTNLESAVRSEIERLASVYNEMNPDDMVMTLSKFYRKASEGALGECKNIKLTYLVSWLRIDSAFPKDHNQPQWGGYLDQLAIKLENAQKEDMNTYCYLILALSAVVCIGMLGIKFFGK